MAESSPYTNQAIDAALRLADGTPKTMRLHTGEQRLTGMDEAYVAAYRDGKNNLIADIAYCFSGEPGTPQTMDEMLAWFRILTGDEELQWPPAPDEPAEWRARIEAALISIRQRLDGIAPREG